MMGVPEGIELAEVRGALSGLPGVADVHDLHVWALASSRAAMTAHLVVDAAVDPGQLRHRAAAMLRERFDIGHATLQIEGSDDCHGPDCGAADAAGASAALSGHHGHHGHHHDHHHGHRH